MTRPVRAHTILDIARQQDALSLDTLCAVHSLVCPEQGIRAGWPRDNNVVVRLAGKIHYRPPPAGLARKRTVGLMAWLTKQLQPNCPPADPVELAMKFYCHFVSAHPFWDGNGRVARSVATWLLALDGQITVDAAELRAYCYKRVNDYYYALAHFGTTADQSPWRSFFLKAVNSLQRPARPGGEVRAGAFAGSRSEWRLAHGAGHDHRADPGNLVVDRIHPRYPEPEARDSSKSQGVFSLVRGPGARVRGGGSRRCGGFPPCTWLRLVSGRG